MGQTQRKGAPRGDREGLDIILPEKKGGRSRGAVKTAAKRAGDTKKRTPRREVELWEIHREDEQPRMMRLADAQSERTDRRKAEGQRPRPIRRETESQKQKTARAAKRRRAKRRKVLLYRCFTLVVIAVCLVLIYQTATAVYRMVHEGEQGKGKGIVQVVSEKLAENKIQPPVILEDYLEINEYSRPGTKLKKVKNIFVHYTANPNTTAQQNRSYFANLAETHERPASAHFIIGYEGELVQCIPLEEQAYAVKTRNEDSVSIECCYQDKEGKFTQETYDTLIHTLAWLLQEYDLSADDILRHYDCGGKLCPLYYVEHEDAWEQLLADVENYKPESGK